MKTKVFTSLLSLFLGTAFAQDRTTVNAMNSEISDNLDLRAVASIFGDSKDLEDFEYRLNDPKNQLSNLDLNNDNQVDYLRVIESTEGNTHIIVIQSVLGKDLYQDVATVEVEKDRNNRVQVQVVGDVYMYGSNYIYEPVYVHTPVIYTYFWTPNYRPYCSSWYWGYYPTYYYAWEPFPIFRYRSHIGLFINFNHHYNYVSYRRCHNAYVNYCGRRANGYERQYPSRSFSHRHSGYTNRYELDRTRNIRTVGTRNDIASTNPRNGGRNETSGSVNYGGPRVTTNNGSRNETSGSVNYGGPRVATNSGSRNETSGSANYGGPRVTTNNGSRNETSGSVNYGGPRVTTNSGSRNETSGSVNYGGPRVNTNNGSRNETSGSVNYGGPRVNTNSGRGNEVSTPRNSGIKSEPRSMNSSKNESGSRGNSGNSRRG